MTPFVGWIGLVTGRADPVSKFLACPSRVRWRDMRMPGAPALGVHVLTPGSTIKAVGESVSR